MSPPAIVFDHFNNVAVIASDPRAGQKLAETLDKERQAVTAACGQPAHRQEP